MSNNINISVLSNGCLNYSKSLLVVSNNDRYLINCGEGTQKIFIENGKKIGSLKNIFLTRKSPQNMCGLIGIALGMNNNNNIELCLHGVEQSVDVIKSSKKFVNEDTCKIIYNNGPIFEDKTFKVDSFVYQSSNEHCSDNCDCVGYLFSTMKLRPKIDVTKCEALGVPRNIIRSKKMAEFLEQTHVTFDDGKIIQSIDVLTASPPAEKFLVIECPSIDYVTSMTERLPIDKFSDENGYVTKIFHLTDSSVYQHSCYQSFIERINAVFTDNPSPAHIVIDSERPFPLSYSTYYLQTCLNVFFDEKLFPKLQLYEDYIAGNHHKDIIDNFPVLVAEPFMNFNLNNISDSKEHTNDTWSRLKYLKENTITDEVMDKNDVFSAECMAEKMQKLKLALAEKKESLKDEYCCEYPNVTFIGTSSSTPSKYRNISSILIEANADVFVLFDCGEGTLDRILTLYGHDRGNEVIRNIRLICISHNHLDHHSGLYTILRYRQLIGLSKSCLILAALNVQMFTSEMDSIFATGHCQHNCQWCRIDLLRIENNIFATDYPRTDIDNFETELGLQINPVRVYHTNTSYGFVLSGTKQGVVVPWKITYSGDRSPKFAGLVREGMDCDLLIHEATMDDGLEEMAARKYHSTVGQAIEQGIKMRAKFTMLTHFSSRHPLVPPVEDQYTNVAQAFDFLRVTLTSCQYLKVLDPYLEFLFPRHWLQLMSDRNKRSEIHPLLSGQPKTKKQKMH